MASDPHDRILESFLKELTRETPKRDFAAEILRKVAETKDAASVTPLEEWIEEPPAKPAATVTTTSEGLGGGVSGSRLWRVSVSIVATSAVILLAAGLIWWMAQPPSDEMDLADDLQRLNDPAPGLLADRESDRREPQNSEEPRLVIKTPDIPRISSDVQIRPDNNVQVPADQTAQVLPGEFQRQVVAPVAEKTPATVAAEIDEIFEETWLSQQVSPVPELDMRSWAVRLSSRLIGRTPTAPELEQIDERIASGVDGETLRGELIEQFTQSPRYQDEFVQHWSRQIAWHLLGLNPRLQTEDPDMQQVRSLVADALRENRPWDEVAYELISAVGSTSESSDNYNPASSYWIGLAKRFGNLELSSSHISDVFLNHQTRCVQCHDSYTNSSLAQSSFWEFRSFFAQLSIEREETGGFAVANRNYLPFGRQGSVSAPLEYKAADGSQQQAFPAFEDLEPVDNGFVAIADRRTALAEYVASSPAYRQALVDLVWTSLLNIPLSTGNEAESSSLAGRVRGELSDQLLANDFDMRWLIETIAMSKPFELGVGTEGQIATDNPYLGEQPLFTRFYHQATNQRSPLLSLSIVASAYETGDVEPALSAGLMARLDGRAEMPKPDPNTIGEYLPTNENQWAVDSGASQLLDRIAASSMSPREKIEHLVLMALERPAMPEEIDKAELILNQADDKRMALQDIWWSLLNSFEYRFPPEVN